MNPQIQSSVTATLLRDVLARKMKRNPSFSLRAFARDLGVSHTYLSLVLNGKKPLSLSKAIDFSQILKLTQEETQSLIDATRRELQERTPNGRRGKKEKGGLSTPGDELPDYFEVEMDRFRVLDDWYHLPILDLTLTQGFRSDVFWIAKRLSISPEQVVNAVQRLLRLGLLVETDGQWTKSRRNLWFAPKNPDAVIRSYHRQMIEKSLKALESGEREDVEAREFNSVTLTMDPSLLPEAKRRIQKFRKSLWKFLASGENATELYQFNLQLFSLTDRKVQVPAPTGSKKRESGKSRLASKKHSGVQS